MALSKNLKALRKARHLTQEKFAMYLGVSTSTIGMYEQGRREPDNDTLIKIANFFHVSTDYLLNNNDNVIVLPQEPKQMLELSKNELELIMKFRELPKDSQDLIKMVLNHECEQYIEPDSPDRA